MTIRITDTTTGRELWTIAQCAAHCGVTASTWRSYSRTGGKLSPPEATQHLDGRTPLWDAEEVKAWHAARPGSPVKNAPRAKAKSKH